MCDLSSEFCSKDTQQSLSEKWVSRLHRLFKQQKTAHVDTRTSTVLQWIQHVEDMLQKGIRAEAMTLCADESLPPGPCASGLLQDHPATRT
eukprot:2477291-Amphidinium_carterae.2